MRIWIIGAALALAGCAGGDIAGYGSQVLGGGRGLPATRAAGLIADQAGRLAKATTATIRRTLIQVPARLARSARRLVLHLPEAWPWQTAFDRLFTTTHAPPPATAH